MLNAIISVVVSAISVVFCFFNPVNLFNRYEYSIDTTNQGREISNMASTLTYWDMGKSFYSPQRNQENDVFEFADYVQLMQCTGGNKERDLFVNPLDTTVLDDYDFERLIKNCRGILSLGAKPYLVTGSVPLKYTQDAVISYFESNAYPPDDYDVYYNYIAAICRALTDAFGVDEVLTWHFGVMTEYENSDWFMAKSKTPEDSMTEYCKLYDTTVAALQDEIGEDVYVGAHSMTVTEGLWDEAEFIKHCAVGTNYRTGETGTRICFLSCSFYDTQLGKYTSGYTLPETVNYLRSTAEKYGLFGLDYGVDEGKILVGTEGKDTNQLLSRTTGFTWQGAYDARLYAQMLENDIDYFSAWAYLTEGIFSGNPTISYHVARQTSRLAGSNTLEVRTESKPLVSSAEVNCVAGYNKNEQTLRFFCYNFKNTLVHFTPANVKFSLDVSDIATDGEVKLTTYSIDDDCNYFDEWCLDRIKYDIGDDCFSWSPDDGVLTTLSDERAKEIYENELYEKYTDCSRLVPQQQTLTVKDGKVTFRSTVKANTVVFFEISK